MSNRLYISDRCSEKYLCIAKNFGDGWKLGNIDLLKGFLNDIEINSNNLVIGKEDDSLFYSICIKNYTNYNSTNKWEEE